MVLKFLISPIDVIKYGIFKKNIVAIRKSIFYPRSTTADFLGPWKAGEHRGMAHFWMA
jgi:hypothetical protein